MVLFIINKNFLQLLGASPPLPSDALTRLEIPMCDVPKTTYAFHLKYLVDFKTSLKKSDFCKGGSEFFFYF